MLILLLRLDACVKLDLVNRADDIFFKKKNNAFSSTPESVHRVFLLP